MVGEYLKNQGAVPPAVSEVVRMDRWNCISNRQGGSSSLRMVTFSFKAVMEHSLKVFSLLRRIGPLFEQINSLLRFFFY